MPHLMSDDSDPQLDAVISLLEEQNELLKQLLQHLRSAAEQDPAPAKPQEV